MHSGNSAGKPYSRAGSASIVPCEGNAFGMRGRPRVLTKMVRSFQQELMHCVCSRSCSLAPRGQPIMLFQPEPPELSHNLSLLRTPMKHHLSRQKPCNCDLSCYSPISVHPLFWARISDPEACWLLSSHPHGSGRRPARLHNAGLTLKIYYHLRTQDPTCVLWSGTRAYQKPSGAADPFRTWEVYFSRLMPPALLYLRTR